jgi:hypothetical protein
VFAVVIKFLTIAAFTMHMVLGCCAHHYHRVSVESCEASSESGHGSPIDASDAEHHTIVHVHRGGCCTHQHAAETHEAKPFNVPADAPCDDVHDCKEPRCTFVASSSQSFASIASFSHVVLCIGTLNERDQFACSIKSNLARRWEASSRFEVSGARCALFQSWQI